MTVPAIRQAKRLIDFYAEDHGMLSIEVVVSHHKKPLFLSRHHQEAAKALDRPLNHWLPHNSDAACEAADRGEPLVERSRRSDLAAALGRLARDIMKSRPAPLATAA
jgi:pilus assembly protein CpaE